MRRETLIIFAVCFIGGIVVTVLVCYVMIYAGIEPTRDALNVSAVNQKDEFRSAHVIEGFGVTRVHLSRTFGLNWGPARATGPPDTPQMGDIPTAWASLSADGQEEWLELDFDVSIIPRTIRVIETNAPGALVAITYVDRSQRVQAWHGIDPQRLNSQGIAVAEVPVKVDRPISSVRLHIDSVRVPGWNEIDAVALVDDQGTPHWATAARASTTYANQQKAPGITFAQLAKAMPYWCRFDLLARRQTTGGPVSQTDVFDARGWPMRALLGPAPPAPSVAGPIPLPVRPIWPGLLIDGALFGAVFLGLYACMFTFRRWLREARRARRGCCIECGYDLRFDLAAGCPECGWRREGSRA